MKKKHLCKLAFGVILAASMVMGSACGKTEGEGTEASEEADEDGADENNSVSGDEAESEGTDEKADETENGTETAAEEGFSFRDVENLQFYFASGAGAWGTELRIYGDGSFSGKYHDSEMGENGDDYPQGTVYVCTFNGKFTTPEKVNDYTYAMKIQTIEYDEPLGKEVLADQVKYVYTDPYGISDADRFLIYLPGAPLEELPEEFLTWIGYYDLSATEDTTLSFYALNNEKQQEGFTSYEADEETEKDQEEVTASSEALKTIIEAAKEKAAPVENALECEELTEEGKLENAKELYAIWDDALNEVWVELKSEMSTDDFESLRVQQRQWIKEKEAAIEAADEKYKGDPLVWMYRDLAGASWTESRVYELGNL